MERTNSEAECRSIRYLFVLFNILQEMGIVRYIIVLVDAIRNPHLYKKGGGGKRKV
jgi:hypothetical protein